MMIKREQRVLFPLYQNAAFVHIVALFWRMCQSSCAALQKVTGYKKILASGDKCDYNMNNRIDSE